MTSGGEVTLSAIVDDTLSGVSDIESAEYSLAGEPWKPMDPQDGSFDSPTENVNADFTVLNPPGDYDVCVRGKDVLGNVGSTTCTQLAVSSAPSEPLKVFIPIISK